MFKVYFQVLIMFCYKYDLKNLQVPYCIWESLNFCLTTPCTKVFEART